MGDPGRRLARAVLHRGGRAVAATEADLPLMDGEERGERGMCLRLHDVDREGTRARRLETGVVEEHAGRNLMYLAVLDAVRGARDVPAVLTVGWIEACELAVSAAGG